MYEPVAEQMFSIIMCVVAVRARRRAAPSAGSTIEIITAMMIRTTISSMSVKPQAATARRAFELLDMIGSCHPGAGSVSAFERHRGADKEQPRAAAGATPAPAKQPFRLPMARRF